MRRMRWVGTVWLWLLWCAMSPLFGDDTGRLIRELRSIPYEARFDHASYVLLKSHDVPQTAARCLSVLLDTSKQLVCENAAIAVIDQFLGGAPYGSSTYQDAFYARAKIMHRSDDPKTKVAAVRRFRQGIARGWVASGRVDAFEVYKESLRENDLPSYMIEQFNYATQNPSVYLRYGDHLSMLGATGLWAGCRRGETYGVGESFCAEEEVLPFLKRAPRLAHHWAIARALCLLIDGRYDAAVEALDRLECRFNRRRKLPSTEDPKAFFIRNERFNVPLYRAAIRLCQGGEYLDAAREAIDDFIDLNRRRPAYLVGKLLRIVYALERQPARDRQRIHEVTGRLIDMGFTSRPKLVRKVGVGLRLHLLDLHSGEFFRQRKWEQAAAFAAQVVEEYDPSQSACNNALFVLGCCRRMLKDTEAAEAAFVRLMEESADPSWRRAAAAQLVRIGIDRDALMSELAPLVELYESYASPKEARFFRYRSVTARYESYLDRRGSDTAER